MEPAPITCRYTFDEIQFLRARACTSHDRWRRNWLKAGGFGLFLITLCSFTAWLRRHEIWHDGVLQGWALLDAYFPFLIVFGVFFIFYAGVNKYQELRAFRQSSPFQKRYDYRIDDSGIALDTEFVKAAIDWPLVDRIIESNEGFVIRLQKMNAFDWLPKEGFSSPEEADRCRELMRRHVSTFVDLRKYHT